MKKIFTYIVLFITLFLGASIKDINAEYKITNDFLKTTRYAQSVLDNYYKKLDANISSTERKIQKLELLVDKINAIENRYKNADRKLSEQSTLLLLAMKQDIINQIRLYRYVYQRDQKDLYIYDILDDDFTNSRYPYIDDDYNDNIPDYDYTGRNNVIRDYDYTKTYRNTDDREIKLADFYIRDNAYNNAKLTIKIDYNTRYLTLDNIYLRSDRGNTIYVDNKRSNSYYTFRGIKSGTRYTLHADIDTERTDFDTTITTKVDVFNGGIYSKNLTLGEVRIDNSNYYIEDDYNSFINYTYTNREEYFTENKYYKVGNFTTKNIRNNPLRIKIKNTNNLRAVNPYLLNGTRKIYLTRISQNENYVTYKIPTLDNYESYELYAQFGTDYNTLNTESIYIYLIGDYRREKNISHFKIKHNDNNEENSHDRVSFIDKTYKYTHNDYSASKYYQIGDFNTLNLYNTNINIKIKNTDSVELENPYVLVGGTKRYLTKVSTSNNIITYKLPTPRSNRYYKIYAKADINTHSNYQTTAQVYVNVNHAWESRISRVIFERDNDIILSGEGYTGTIYGGLKRNTTYKIGAIETGTLRSLKLRIDTNVDTLHASTIYLKSGRKTILGKINYDTVSFDNVTAGTYSLYARFDKDNNYVRKIEVTIIDSDRKGAVIGTVNFPFSY